MIDLALHDRTATEDLPRSRYSTRGQADVQDEDHRLVAADALALEDGVEALAVAAEHPERIDDAGRPVDADDVAAATSRFAARIVGP